MIFKPIESIQEKGYSPMPPSVRVDVPFHETLAERFLKSKIAQLLRVITKTIASVVAIAKDHRSQPGRL
jgi:hypothetical protein